MFRSGNMEADLLLDPDGKVPNRLHHLWHDHGPLVGDPVVTVAVPVSKAGERDGLSRCCRQVALLVAVDDPRWSFSSPLSFV